MATKFQVREAVEKPPVLVSGHRLCPGCGIGLVLRQVFAAVDGPFIITNATGCLEVCSGEFPYTAWAAPWIHNTFGSAASTAAGIEAMYRNLKKLGKYDRDVKILALGGDGGTYDIGFAALSGAMERGHKMVYLCCDNQGYMNTGGQRSSSTPFGASTATSPAGQFSAGKAQFRKDITKIMAAHGIPYAAQMAPSKWRDTVNKAMKAFEADGPAFLVALCACPTDWKHPSEEGLEITQAAVESGIWPLYEIENGFVRITYRPKTKVPVEEFLKTQGRFRHLLKPENAEVIAQIQADVDRRWEILQAEEAMGKQLKLALTSASSVEPREAEGAAREGAAAEAAASE